MKYTITIEIGRNKSDYHPLTNSGSIESEELTAETLETVCVAMTLLTFKQAKVKYAPEPVSSADEEITPPPSPKTF